MIDVARCFDAVRDRVRRACERSGRDPAAVRIVAVTKTVDAGRIRRLADHGHRLFGENKVQEAQQKMPLLGDDVRWHMIGHLQRNKARHAVGRFELIHAVDSDRLAAEIDRRAAAAGLRQAVLVQVNLSGEPSKHGVDAGALAALVDAIAALEHVELRGLMTMPPPVTRAEDSRGWFRRLRELREVEAARSGLALAELSMGMTDDFEVAVEEGATLVRVGRAIFGERPA
jgi:pyridoxal phosphate enzyme (YggS family)